MLEFTPNKKNCFVPVLAYELLALSYLVDTAVLDSKSLKGGALHAFQRKMSSTAKSLRKISLQIVSGCAGSAEHGQENVNAQTKSSRPTAHPSDLEEDPFYQERNGS